MLNEITITLMTHPLTTSFSIKPCWAVHSDASLRTLWRRATSHQQQTHSYYTANICIQSHTILSAIFQQMIANYPSYFHSNLPWTFPWTSSIYHHHYTMPDLISIVICITTFTIWMGQFITVHTECIYYDVTIITGVVTINYYNRDACWICTI